MKQARSLANLQVSSKGLGDYLCTVNKTQREQLNVRERAKPDAEFAELKGTWLHSPEALSIFWCRPILQI